MKNLSIHKSLFVALLLVFSIDAYAYDFEEGNVSYEINTDGSVSITGCLSKDDSKLVIPDVIDSRRVKYIKGGAFIGCNNLKEVIIGDSIRSIGYDAFNSCDSLTSVTIGKCVRYIEKDAFFRCKNLKSIHLKCERPPIVKGGNFTYKEIISYNVYTFDTYAKTTLYVPKGALPAYYVADAWRYFEVIEEDISNVRYFMLFAGCIIGIGFIAAIITVMRKRK